MNKKKVGVILTYNCEKLVQKAIDNIPKNFFDTVICSDDGSTDKTLKILEENNIPVYQHKHLGYGGNIYSGMEIAFKKYNADYVYELHGDSQYDFKSTLFAEEKFQKENAELILVIGFLNTNKKEEVIIECFFRKYFFFFFSINTY